MTDLKIDVDELTASASRAERPCDGLRSHIDRHARERPPCGPRLCARGCRGVELLARDAADPDRLLDLEPAAQGLPDGVDYVWVDGGLTMLSNALAAP